VTGHGGRRGRPQGPCCGTAQGARRWPCGQAIYCQPSRARLRLCSTGDARERAVDDRAADRSGRGRQFAGAGHAGRRPRRCHLQAGTAAVQAPLRDDLRVRAGSARPRWLSPSPTACALHTAMASGMSSWLPCWGSILLSRSPAFLVTPGLPRRTLVPVLALKALPPTGLPSRPTGRGAGPPRVVEPQGWVGCSRPVGPVRPV
jgi:hypothetical protein